MAEKNPRRNETIDALFDAILSLETREECYDFFEDLCTVKEISDMAQLLEAAKLLLDGTMLLGGTKPGSHRLLAGEGPLLLTAAFSPEKRLAERG